jgi:3-(3-hydroxy-phenyl)propionate hydroxylase
VRRAAGIAFPGWDPTISWLLAEVRMTEAPPLGFHEDALGKHAISKIGDSDLYGAVLVERDIRSTDRRTLADASAALTDVFGTDFGAHSPVRISSFTDMTRQAERYRDRRILLVGDAAHVHPPLGGQGLNLAVQDAANLGWKLAQVVKGTAPETLLDSYHAERHPVGAGVLRNTMAHIALRRNDARSQALADVVDDLLRMDGPRKHLAGSMSGLDIHYDLGAGHPLLGRRMPDLDLTTAAGSIRCYSLLHRARPVLINLGAGGRFDIGPWSNRVHMLDATCDAAWELPVIGPVPAPDAVLVRPDGYVAWVGGPDSGDLTVALTRWFGAPRCNASPA